MKVYLLHGGFDYEGSRVLAVFYTQERADGVMKQIEAHNRDPSVPLPVERSAHYDFYHVLAMEIIP